MKVEKKNRGRGGASGNRGKGNESKKLKNRGVDTF